ncbi:hypothetical protein V6N13_007933 [Hibiscus sabdariffa]|uniref:Uncharacterized protein n=1 Tax=Hibiscus sabdariffa TaxID=183260 RepID=A0ABR2EDZ2_9ROSI
MAAPSSPPSLSHTHEKHHSFLLLLTLFFLFILLLNPSTNPIHSSSLTPSIPFKRLLLHNSSESSAKQMRNRRTSSSKSSRREFGTDAHEVPSGPNPISNR